MSTIELAGLIVVGRGARLPDRGARAPGAVLGHDRRRLDRDPPLRRDAHRAHPACSAATWRACSAARSRALGRRRARALPRARRRPRARPGLEGLRPLRADLERAVRRPAVRDPAHAGRPAAGTRRTLRSGTWDLSFNTTASFLSRTRTGSSTRGETTMSYFSQMAGLAVQNFISAGVGIAVLVAFVRALASRSGKEIGVFYVDLTRTILYVLLPLSIVVGLVLVSQGVLQTLGGYVDATGLTGVDADLRLRAGRGPGGDQDARHQRRRLLQRQLGDAVREPDVALELRRDAGDPRDPRRPDRDVRPHGRQPPPGLDGLRRDDDAVRRRGRGDLRQRDRPDAGDAGRGPDRRQPRGQGDALRHRLERRCSPRSRPPRRAARSTRRWSRSAASAARSRWRR